MTETIPNDRLEEHERRVLGAFKLAMIQLGVAERPDGKCPAADCNCAAMGDAVDSRASELLADPDIEDAQLCADCRVLVPFQADCYGIDCGDVVCLPCGKRRELDDGYKLP